MNKLPRLSIDYESLREQLQSRYVVISGGEPLFHQDFEELLERLVGDDFEVAVETSGAKAFPFEKFPQVWVTFSPKLHATDYLKGQPSPTFWTHSREIKVVISEPSDLNFYEDLLDQASASEIPVFLQPEWSKREFLTSFILTTLQKKPAWQFSIQQHKYLNLS